MKGENQAFEMQMPELRGYDYLLNWFFDMGLTLQSPMGEVPLPLTEIYAWGKNLELTHFEAKTLHDMSLWYASMKSRATEPGFTRPFVPEKEISKVDQKIDDFFKSYKELKR